MKYLVLLRPQQWLKNTFVFMPIFFSGNMFNIPLLINSVVAFFCFSFVSSSIYCLNDIMDVEADRLHTTKRKRPIASGIVSIKMAYFLVVFMALVSIILAIVGLSDKNYNAITVLLFYYAMNIAYCFGLKQIALIDVFIISIGFVLRVIIGGVVNEIELSIWIIIMTFLLALFLALAKRRDDVVLFQDKGIIARSNIKRYNIDFINQSISMVATITIIAYIMYTVSPEVLERFGTKYIYITTVFVLLGILRYLQLTIVDVKSGSPTKVLATDKFIQLCILGWVTTFLVIIYVM